MGQVRGTQGECESCMGGGFTEICLTFQAMGYRMWCLFKSPRGTRRIGPMYPV